MDPYIGEIRVFAGTFAPLGWAFCDGSMLQVMQYQPLFSVISNKFGGDGKTTFALPDLRGKVAMHAGTGSGLTPREFASQGGESTVKLTHSQLAAHNHLANCQSASDSQSPMNNVWGSGPARPVPRQLYAPVPDQKLHPGSLSFVGGNLPHNNMQPYLGLNFIIAVDGIYPVKS